MGVKLRNLKYSNSDRSNEDVIRSDVLVVPLLQNHLQQTE